MIRHLDQQYGCLVLEIDRNLFTTYNDQDSDERSDVQDEFEAQDEQVVNELMVLVMTPPERCTSITTEEHEEENEADFDVQDVQTVLASKSKLKIQR